MNKTVTATGMKVQARAEGGIVIARTGTTRDTATDTATVSLSAQKLLPTSTADGETWYHAEAAAANDEAALAGTMKTLTLTGTAPTSSALGTKYPSASADTVYVLYDTYTIYPDKNSTSFTDLWVSSCTASSATKDLSKSLRVAIVCGSNVVICAPVSGASLTYTVGTNPNGTTAVGTGVKALNTSGTGSTLLAMSESGDTKNILVPANTVTNTSGIAVSVYVYFEGEDGNHYTNNLNVTGADEELTITVKFSCTSVSAAT